jgi:succinoglycan biosynthesis transport protein ExoP
MERRALFTPLNQPGTRQGMEACWFRESFFSLNAQLSLRGDDKNRSLIVISANPQEGRSTVAVNLALVMTGKEGRVLLVDADMRQPILHKVFRGNNSPGLTDLLEDGSDGRSVEDAIQEVGRGLFLLPHGMKSSNDPAGLFRSPNFVQLFQTLKERYTSVLWDTSPILSAFEVVPLASLVDRALLVLGAGKVTLEESRKTKALLERAGCRIVGAVLNGIDRRYAAKNHSANIGNRS